MLSLKSLYNLRLHLEKDPEGFSRIYEQLPREAQEFIAEHWYFGSARLNQIIPWHLDWRFELDFPGRGFGKNWKLSRNIVELATNPELIEKFTAGKGNLRINVYGETISECENTIISGESGIANALNDLGYTIISGKRTDRPKFKEVLYLMSMSLLQLKFQNGTIIRFYGSSKTKGKQAHVTFADEVLTFYEDEVNHRDDKLSKFYEETLTTTRLGPDPRIVWISTPRPVPIFKKLLKRAEDRQDMLLVTGSTFDNPYLSDDYKNELMSVFGNTRRGLQELYGQVTWEVPGALFIEKDIIKVDQLPTKMSKIVIGVDPATSSSKESDETGIIVAGKGTDGSYYVLEDASGRYTPQDWARIVINLYDKYQANQVIYETNQGGDMVKEVLRSQRRTLACKGVRASKGKYARAEPIAALYEQHKVYHLKTMPKLETQMMEYSPQFSAYSPDRLDALVWALHDLSQTEKYFAMWV